MCKKLDTLLYLSWLQAACEGSDADRSILGRLKGEQPRCRRSRGASGCQSSRLIGRVWARFAVGQVQQGSGVVADRRGPELDQGVGEFQRRADTHRPARQMEISEHGAQAAVHVDENKS